MYVQEIVQQQGNMTIRSKGKITSAAVIEQMKKKGILKVAIDPTKGDTPQSEQEAAAQQKTEAEQQSEAKQDTQADAKSGKPLVSFDQEISRAQKLNAQGKGIQKRMLNAVMKDLPVDIAIPTEFTQNLVGSIDRNPNALMCLTKIREKDTYLLEHSLNVAVLLANFGRHLELPTEQVQELTLAGFLHDIGKIKVPDKILHKPGRLTDQEMDVMRDHVKFGVETLQQMDIPDHIIRTMAEHHERLDGEGYPRGAKGDEVSYFGRMIAIVDSYDAMTADRCYKAGMPSQKALKILMKDSPAKYDKELVQHFIKCVGIYPVGSLVQLNSEHVAMVLQQNDDHPLEPVVKLFYTMRGNHFVTPKEVDLNNSQYEIEKALIASDLNIDLNRFFAEQIAP